jgi:MFS family permease
MQCSVVGLTTPHSRAEHRRAVIVVYALIFYTAAMELAIVPLLPVFSAEFDLSTVGAGALLASASVTVMVASVPLGHLSDRIGARKMTIAAALVFSVAAIGQGLAQTYVVLLLSWALFGVGVAIAVTGSLAWLSDLLPETDRTAALGGAAAVSGIGVVAGPLFGGLVVEHLGRNAAFLIVALAMGLVGAATQIWTRDTRHEQSALPLLATVNAVRHEPLVIGGLTLVGLLGFVFGTVNVLIPLQLSANGLSSSQVGLAFSATAVVFVAVSLVVARLGARAVTVRVAAIAVFAQAGLLAIPIVSLTTVAMVSFLFLRAPVWAAAATISYPLTSLGAHRAGLGRGAIFGILNLVWGAAAVLSPLAGGAIAQAFGERWAYAVLALVCVSAGTFLASQREHTASGARGAPLA